VQPELQGRGIEKALIKAGLEWARGPNGAFRSTGTAANVTIYGRCGFRVYDEADARRVVRASGSCVGIRELRLGGPGASGTRPARGKDWFGRAT
jgi:GNAT superfamily N-acetyltransferase